MTLDLSPEALGEEVVVSVVDGPLYWVVLNRPHRMNAWTPAMDVAFTACLEEAAASPDARVVLVTGAGRGFCAGGDMEELGDLVQGDQEYPGAGNLYSQILEVPKPVIAVVNGGCAGSGFALALMCDLRFAAASAKLTAAFPRRGLPAEHGTSWVLPRVVGHAHALDILLSGRKLTASETERMGLVAATYDDSELLERVRDYALDMAAHCSPRSMAMIKRQAFADTTRGFAEALAEAETLTIESHGSPDATEGWKSFVEGRPPAFPPL
ncbi:MAG: enoyl-CoA hydratase-related protein [Nocardioidaceae bacterium]